MAQHATERRRAKVSVTVDPDLLRAVDEFVQHHSGSDRSKVFDEALALWYAQRQTAAMEEQFAAPRSAEELQELAAWRRIQSAAAGRVFHQHRGR
ncbi:MAG: hypothetical protein HY331_05160 [Chloroflexi bacterium]|nr:hypothetical protein [Chloroflexota bacterium]